MTEMADEKRDFGYKVRLAGNFQEVLDEGPDAPEVDLPSFAEVVLRSACTLLQARGGAGKTRTATRLGRLLEDQGETCVIVSAVNLSDDEAVSTLGAAKWTRISGDAHDNGLLPADPRLIVIDGLNEVDRVTGERILEAIGPYTALNPQTSVLVTDRLTRRLTASPFWRYATLLPVPAAVIWDVTGSPPTEAYGIPFYLDRHEEGRGAQEILKESILRYVSLEELPKLAAASYRSYDDHKKRTLDRETVVDAVGTNVWQVMIDGRAVVQVGADDFYFEHHLLHDYLAGFHLASNPQLWDSDGFDVVTFNASSFDALALSLAQLDSQAAVEDLVQRVYDWNFYAAAYMLEEDRAGNGKISDAMELALLGALAEKRFEKVRPTVVRVEDALRVQSNPLSRALLAAPDRGQVVEILRAAAPPGKDAGWFDRWWDYFSRSDGSVGSKEDIAAVVDSEPVVGWGAANAMRRMALPKPMPYELRVLLKGHASSTARWRAAHALGTHPEKKTLEALRKAVRDDPDRWVRYGALRAMFEHIMSAQPSTRSHLVSTLMDDLTAAIATPGLLRTEAIRCLDLEPLPLGNWHADVEPILDLLWETADAKGMAELANLAERLRRQKKGSHVA